MKTGLSQKRIGRTLLFTQYLGNQILVLLTQHLVDTPNQYNTFRCTFTRSCTVDLHERNVITIAARLVLLTLPTMSAPNTTGFTWDVCGRPLRLPWQSMWSHLCVVYTGKSKSACHLSIGRHLNFTVRIWHGSRHCHMLHEKNKLYI